MMKFYKNGPDNDEKNETFTKTNDVEGFALEKFDNGNYNLKFYSENKTLINPP